MVRTLSSQGAGRARSSYKAKADNEKERMKSKPAPARYVRVAPPKKPQVQQVRSETAGGPRTHSQHEDICPSTRYSLLQPIFDWSDKNSFLYTTNNLNFIVNHSRNDASHLTMCLQKKATFIHTVAIFPQTARSGWADTEVTFPCSALHFKVLWVVEKITESDGWEQHWPIFQNKTFDNRSAPAGHQTANISNISIRLKWCKMVKTLL